MCAAIRKRKSVREADLENLPEPGGVSRTEEAVEEAALAEDGRTLNL